LIAQESQQWPWMPSNKEINQVLNKEEIICCLAN